MLFERFPYRGARARMFGANIGGLTLSQLQAIQGTLSLTSEGYTFYSPDQSCRCHEFRGGGDGYTERSQCEFRLRQCINRKFHRIRDGVVHRIYRSNCIDGDSIESGSIEIGTYLSVPSIDFYDLQVITQLSGTPNGIGTYVIRDPGGDQSAPLESMTDSYGVLTVGSVSSGTVATGQEVAGAGVGANTAIQENLSGSGAGSTWVVSDAESVAREAMKTTAAPLAVTESAIAGATSNSISFWIEESGREQSSDFVDGLRARHRGDGSGPYASGRRQFIACGAGCDIPIDMDEQSHSKSGRRFLFISERERPCRRYADGPGGLGPVDWGPLWVLEPDDLHIGRLVEHSDDRCLRNVQRARRQRADPGPCRDL